MLSRKQIWRKTQNKSYSLPFSVYSVLSKDDDTVTTMNTSVSDLSLAYSSNTYCPSPQYSECDERRRKSKKSVRFSTHVKVCVVPTREELLPFSSEIFWKTEDCEAFKQNAFREIKSCTERYSCSIKEAVIILYQNFDEVQQLIN